MKAVAIREWNYKYQIPHLIIAEQKTQPAIMALARDLGWTSGKNLSLTQVLKITSLGEEFEQALDTYNIKDFSILKYFLNLQSISKNALKKLKRYTLPKDLYFLGDGYQYCYITMKKDMAYTDDCFKISPEILHID